MSHIEKSNSQGLFINIKKISKLIWNYSKTYLVLKIGITLIKSVLPVLSAWYSAKFINIIVTEKFSSIYDPKIFFIISFYVGFLILTALFDVLYRYLDGRFFIQFTQKFDILFIKKRAEIDIQKYEDPKFNDLVTKANENFYRVYSFTDFLVYALENIIQILIALFIIIKYKWWVALILVISLIPDLIIEIKYGRSIYGIWGAKAEVKRKYFENRKHFFNIASLIELKIFNLKNYFITNIDNLLTSFNKEVIKTDKKKYGLKFLSTFTTFSVTGLIIFLLINDVVSGVLLVGTFTFLLSQINNLRGSITNFFFNISRIYGDNLYVGDIFNVLSTLASVKDGSIKLGEKTPDIEFKEVSFSYPEQESCILKNISLKICAGEKIAIVGVNGAGKTTFTKIVMRFYDPTKGTIMIDGENLKNIKLETYYNKIGLLSQEYAKYKLPVKQAIALGDTEEIIDMEKVYWAAEQSGADEFIKEFKNGYDTQLGKEFEGGVEPSIGQWQKLALARIFYKNPQIWVLDEPTASIDAVAEMSIFNKLENLPKDKTVILISHRFNTVKNADKIIVIEHGEIVEMGNHTELMNKNGIYTNLFNTQKDSYE